MIRYLMHCAFVLAGVGLGWVPHGLAVGATPGDAGECHAMTRALSRIQDDLDAILERVAETSAAAAVRTPEVEPAPSTPNDVRRDLDHLAELIEALCLQLVPPDAAG